MLQKKVLRKSTSTMLDIQESSGKANIYKTAWCVIGPPGIGKSTLFSGFEGCLFLCTSEKEVQRLNVPYIVIDSWEKVLNVTDELVNNRNVYSQYKFLVIDFIDAVWTLCITAVCEKLGVQHTSDAGYGKGVDTVDQYFKRWVTALIASDYGIMFVSHINQKDVMVQGGTLTKSICTLPNRARMILFPLINVIGCMEYETIREQQGAKIVLVKKRVILFEATEYIEAKDRDGVLPSKLVLSRDARANFQKFKEYYNGKGGEKG